MYLMQVRQWMYPAAQTGSIQVVSPSASLLWAAQVSLGFPSREQVAAPTVLRGASRAGVTEPFGVRLARAS